MSIAENSAMNNHAERIARLEAAEEMTTEALKDLTKELKGLRSDFNAWRGFFGGVIFTVGAIWAMIQFGFKALIEFVKN